MKIVNEPWSNFTVDSNGPLILLAPLAGVVQRYILAVYRPVILHLCYYSKLPGHLGEIHIYNTMHDQHYWHKCKTTSTELSKTENSARVTTKHEYGNKRYGFFEERTTRMNLGWHTGPFTKNKKWQPIHRHNNGPLFNIDQTDTYCKKTGKQ